MCNSSVSHTHNETGRANGFYLSVNTHKETDSVNDYQRPVKPIMRRTVPTVISGQFKRKSRSAVPSVSITFSCMTVMMMLSEKGSYLSTGGFHHP